MMTDKIYTIKEIQEKIQSMAEKYKLKKVSLFGSYARGEASKDSDIDLYIVDGDTSYKGIPWGYFRFCAQLEEELGKKVDVVTAAAIKQKWNMWSTRLLFKNIKEDEVVLYERRTIPGYQRTGTYDNRIK